MIEVRCCCEPENLIGHVPEEEGLKAGLVLRETEPEGFAFDSNHDEEAVRRIPGFEEARGPKGPKTWKKTWKK